jgi:hypothetical protein
MARGDPGIRRGFCFDSRSDGYQSSVASSDPRLPVAMEK